jgi:hypothetical protein
VKSEPTECLVISRVWPDSIFLDGDMDPLLRLLRRVGNGFYVPLLEGKTLEECMTSPELNASLRADAAQPGSLESPKLRDDRRAALDTLMAMILYLCSAKLDVTRAGAPRAHRARGPQQTAPSFAVCEWDVGVRIGAALRRAAEDARNETTASPAGTDPLRRPRPHMRRAHWHGYWSGPRSEQQFDFTWLPPIPVNVQELGALPAVMFNLIEPRRPAGD